MIDGACLFREFFEDPYSVVGLALETILSDAFRSVSECMKLFRTKRDCLMNVLVGYTFSIDEGVGCLTNCYMYEGNWSFVELLGL